MSRIGNKPIIIPAQVTVKVKDNQVLVAGPKGELSLSFRPEIKVEVNQSRVEVSRKDDSRLARSLHGLTRTLVSNLIEGVTQGFEKTLKLVGIGYRVALEGDTLLLNVGFSHPVKFSPPPGIEFAVDGNDTIKISGIDKILVGQVAADLRAIRPPEPYKGKGIRYPEETIRIKAGKAGRVGAAAGVGAGAAAPGGGK